MARTITPRLLLIVSCLSGVLLVGGAMHLSATNVEVAPAEDATASTTAISPAVQRLDDMTEGDVRVQIDSATGLARFVGFGLEGFRLETPEQRNEARSERALAFLEAHGAAFGVSDARTQLQYARERQNSNGSQVDFRQVHLGVHVRHGGLSVVFDHDSDLIAVDSKFLADVTVNTTPGIDVRAARSLAVEAVTGERRRKSDFSQANLRVSSDTLVVHRTPAGAEHLAYEVEVGQGDDATLMFIDSHSGQPLGGSGAEKTVAESLETKTVSVTGTFTTVGLTNTYADPVVVCTAQYRNNSVPIVTRVRNVGPTSFEVRLQNPGDLAAVVAETVHCLIVESGTHTYDGHVIQATHYTSTVTDRKGSWAGELQTYGHAFTNPVVIGQVMTQNDALGRWSVFWDKGASYRATPPTPTTLHTGKTVMEDTDTGRTDEEVGFIVFDTTHGMIGGVEFEAARGPKTIAGAVNSPPYVYTYDTAFPAAPDVALNSLAGIVGGDGSWSQSHASSPSTTATTLQLSVDEDLIGDAERSHDLEQTAYVVFASEVVFPDLPPATCPGGLDSDCTDDLFCNGIEACVANVCQPSTGDPCVGFGQLCDEDIDACVTGPALRMETFALSGIDGSFQTIGTFHTYVSPVVVCDVEYETNTTPIVIRLDNVNPLGFDIKLQNPSGGAVSAEDAWCIVMEEGAWQMDGVKFEAQKYVSTVTDSVSAWTGTPQTYNQPYTTPTVIGQVQTSNDPAFSVYWQQGATRTSPPTATALKNGKTVLGDTDKSRVDETVGFIVFESGHGPFLGSTYEAATGGDTVGGAVNAAPYEYIFKAPFLTTPDIGITTMSGVDGGDGAWSQRHATSPSATPTRLFVSVDEDQIGDAERSHTTEQLSYLVFEDEIAFPPVSSCNVDADCPGFADFCDGPDNCNNGACIKGPAPCSVGETCNEASDICEGPAAKVETLLVQNVVGPPGVTPVSFTNTYDSPVVVCSIKYVNNTLPVVPRVGNITGIGFDLYIQNPSGAPPALDDVYCLVAEEGIWNVGGTLFEAQKYTATITDRDPNWLGTAQSFGNAYTSPVIVGQVMSCNDPLWSVYWQSGAVRSTPPDINALRNGKGVLEDSNPVRADEEVGFIVFEEGPGLLDVFNFEAFLTADFVRDVTFTPPYIHTLTAFAVDPAFAVLSGAGVDGVDGYWPYLYGANPIRQTEIDLAIDEDQLENLERGHTTEQIMGIVFEDLFAFVDNVPPVAQDDEFTTDEDNDFSDNVITNTVPNGIDDDADGDPFDVTLVNGGAYTSGVPFALPSGALLTMNTNGAFTYDPNGQFEGLNTGQDDTDSFTYTIEGTPVGLPDTATATITIDGVNDEPTATNLTRAQNYTEDDASVALDDIVVTDPDDTSITVVLTLARTATGSLTTGSGNGETYNSITGVWTITGTVAGVNAALAAVAFTPAANNDINTTITTHVEDAAPSGPADGSIALNVTAVNDPPTVPVNDGITVDEGGTETIDTTELDFSDPDDSGAGLTWTITSAPANGQVELTTGPGTAIGSFTQDDLDNNRVVYVHDGSETISDSFDFSLADGGEDGAGPALGTVNVTVNPVNDPPTGAADAWDAVGNTLLLVDKATTNGAEIIATTGSGFGVLDNDGDIEGDSLTVSGIVGCLDISAPFTDCPTANGGKVTMESNGTFSYISLPGDNAATDSFQYTPFDGTDDGANTTVTLTRKNRVWYVKNDTAGADLGTSVDPFDALADAEAASTAGDTLFVFEGDGTTLGQDAGITLKTQQRLLGEGVALTVPDTVNGVAGPALFAAGNRPEVEHTAGDAVTVDATAGNRVDVEIRGLDLAAAGNMIDVTSSGPFEVGVTITDNFLRNSGAEGVDLNPCASGDFDVTFENNIFAISSATGNAFDLRTTVGVETVELSFNNNSNITSSAGTAVNINGSAGGNLFIRSFSGNSVHGNTGGIGINILAAKFDADPSDADFDLVSCGVTTVGSMANPVGASGVFLGTASTASSGNLAFTQLDIFNSSGGGLNAGGSGTASGGSPPTSGFQLATTTGTIATVGGAAVSLSNLTSGVTLATISSISNSSIGVNLTSIDGTFTVSSTTVTDPLSHGILVDSLASGTTVSFGSTTVSRGSGIAGLGQALRMFLNTGATINFSPLNAITWLTSAAGGGGLQTFGGGTVNLGGAVAINAEGGPAVDIQSVATTGTWTFSTLTSLNSSSDGIKLFGLTNNFTVTGTTDIDDPATEGIEVDGSSVDYSFATVDIDIEDPGAHGIDLDGLTGSFTINSVGGGIDYEPTAADDRHNILINNCSNVTISGAAATCTAAVKTGCFTLSDAGTGGLNSGLGPDNSGFHAIAITSSGDIDLDSIFIDGHGGANSPGADSGVFIVDPDAGATVDIDDSFFNDVDEDCIEVEKTNASQFTINVRNNEFEGSIGSHMESAVHLDDWSAGNIVALIDGNTIDEMDTTGFIIRPSGTSGTGTANSITITDNVLRDSDNNGVIIEATDSSVSDVVIKGNTLIGETGNIGAVGDDEALDIAILGTNSTATLNVTVGGPNAADRNTITDWDDYGIRISTIGSGIAGTINATVENNFIEDLDTGGGSNDIALLIEVDDSATINARVIDNEFANNTGGFEWNPRSSTASLTRVFLSGNESPLYHFDLQPSTSYELGCTDLNDGGVCDVNIGLTLTAPGDTATLTSILNADGNTAVGGGAATYSFEAISFDIINQTTVTGGFRARIEAIPGFAGPDRE